MIIQLTKAQYIALERYKASVTFQTYEGMLGDRVIDSYTSVGRDALGEFNYSLYLNMRSIGLEGLNKLNNNIREMLAIGEKRIDLLPRTIRGID